MAEYKLSLTANEIDERLKKVSQLSENVGSLQTDVGGLQTDIQDKAEIMMLTTAEYEALDQIDDKTLYMFTDEEEEIEIPTKVSELENDVGYLTSVPDEYITETELTSKGYLTEHQSLEDYVKTSELGTLAKKSSVAKTDLASTVQTSLNKADTALQSIPSEYITETELNSKGYLTSYTETDPTVPAWAKASKKPTYTASEVGADASGTASSAVSTHNTNTSAHNDIRNLISGLTTRLNTLADSDDTTLDQMSEIVAYIKSNKSLIDSVTTNKVNVSDIINNLTTNVSNKPLSAAQGVTLKGLIDALQTSVNAKAATSDLTSHTGNTTVHITSTERTNWNAAKAHADSAHAPSNAEKNQNAFSNVVVGSTTISADTVTDSLTLVGSNVTITPDATNDKVTIGITKDNVTTALGYTPPTTNTTYKVVSTTADGLAPKRDGSTTKFLRADGTWAVPPDTNTVYTHPSYTAKNSGLYKVTVDSTGHVSGATVVTKSDITALGIPAQDTTYSLSSFGISATAAELNYCDGVTSNIQTQLNNKQTKITGTAGQFVVIGNDGNVTTKTIAYAEGVSF